MAGIVATIGRGVQMVLGTSTPSLSDYYDSNLVTKIGQLVTTVLGWITSNPILALFFTMSMIGFAFVVIGWLKGAIRLK